MGLGLLALVQLPLAWSLARRLRRRQREREELLERAIAASEDERRRIAADLHDGVVQDLAGVAFAQAAAAEETDPNALKASLGSAAAQTRQCIRSLRSLLVDIYPPNLRRAGLHDIGLKTGMDAPIAVSARALARGGAYTSPACR